MYLTIKDRAEYSNVEDIVTRTNLIDDLFNGVDLDTIDTSVFSTSDKVLVRTKTMEVDNCNTNYTSREQVLFASGVIKRITERHPSPQDEYYTFKIPKKTHGFREINAPQDSLKNDMKQILQTLDQYLKLLTHDSAWAYTQGRDVVHAMKEHTKNNSRWYLKLDLHDFFGSCNPTFIKEQLKKIYPFAKYPEESVELIDNLVNIAILNDGLPQGTPLSPMLTNLIMIEFDYKINRLLYSLTKDTELLKQKYIYTRYADDIIISARNKFDYNIIVAALKELFEDTPLQLNEEKTRFGSSSGRNWNLGVMCNKDNKITIGYRKKQQLKAAINNYMNSREQEPWDLQDLYWLQGQLSWLNNVEPEYFKGFTNYLYNKYDTNVIHCITLDIKQHN